MRLHETLCSCQHAEGQKWPHDTSVPNAICVCPCAVCFVLQQEPSSIEKVAEIDEHIGCAMSGLTADAKTLIDHARADTQVRAVLQCVCLLMHPGCASTKQTACCPSGSMITLQQASAVVGMSNACLLQGKKEAFLTHSWHHLLLPHAAPPVSFFVCTIQQHRFTYNEPMPVESCTQSLCDLALRFGEDSDEAGMVRESLLMRPPPAC